MTRSLLVMLHACGFGRKLSTLLCHPVVTLLMTFAAGMAAPVYLPQNRPWFCDPSNCNAYHSLCYAAKRISTSTICRFSWRGLMIASSSHAQARLLLNPSLWRLSFVAAFFCAFRNQTWVSDIIQQLRIIVDALPDSFCSASLWPTLLHEIRRLLALWLQITATGSVLWDTAAAACLDILECLWTTAPDAWSFQAWAFHSILSPIAGLSSDISVCAVPRIHSILVIHSIHSILVARHRLS